MMKTSINCQSLDNHELMETRGGFQPIYPSPAFWILGQYGAEICDGITHAYKSFVAGLLGQPEP
jgi:hypothetical protein